MVPYGLLCKSTSSDSIDMLVSGQQILIQLAYFSATITLIFVLISKCVFVTAERRIPWKDFDESLIKQ